MRIASRLLAALAIACATPWVQVQIACRDRFSEACVWGKAYLPLSTKISAVILTPVVFGVLWGIEAGARRLRGRSTTVN
jgi:hypothetical protein